MAISQSSLEYPSRNTNQQNQGILHAGLRAIPATAAGRFPQGRRGGGGGLSCPSSARANCSWRVQLRRAIPSPSRQRCVWITYDRKRHATGFWHGSTHKLITSTGSVEQMENGLRTEDNWQEFCRHTQPRPGSCSEQGQSCPFPSPVPGTEHPTAPGSAGLMLRQLLHCPRSLLLLSRRHHGHRAISLQSSGLFWANPGLSCFILRPLKHAVLLSRHLQK